jgi:hypothetical protein
MGAAEVSGGAGRSDRNNFGQWRALKPSRVAKLFRSGRFTDGTKVLVRKNHPTPIDSAHQRMVVMIVPSKSSSAYWLTRMGHPAPPQATPHSWGRRCRAQKCLSWRVPLYGNQPHGPVATRRAAPRSGNLGIELTLSDLAKSWIGSPAANLRAITGPTHLA